MLLIVPFTERGPLEMSLECEDLGVVEWKVPQEIEEITVIGVDIYRPGHGQTGYVVFPHPCHLYAGDTLQLTHDADF